MKRHLIFFVMLVFFVGLNAQTTNTRTKRESNSSRTAVKKTRETDEKKESVKKETPSDRNDRTVKEQSPRTRESDSRTTTTPRSNSEVRQAPDSRKSSTSTNNSREVNRTGNSSNQNGNSSDRYQRTPPKENRTIRTRPSDSQGTVNRSRSSSSVDRKVYVPRNENEFSERRRTYTSPERRVVNRQIITNNYVHRPIEYRRTYYPYRVPSRPDIIWNIHLYNEYRYLYPHYDYWYYPVGYRIHTISAYDADRYIGEFTRVYGRVYEVWRSGETDEYFLYFGEPYPYQDFTVILSGRDARRYSRIPERYFPGKDIAVTGIISVFEDKPEMVIKKRSQIDIYFR